MRVFFAVSQVVAIFVAMLAAAAPAGAQVEAKPELPAAAAAGLAYGDARQALLDTGWRPQPTAECASNMGVGFEKLCQTLPETESCSGDGYCLFHFSHEPGWVLTITTYGDYGRALHRGSKTGINIEALDLASSRANADSAGMRVSRKYSQKDYVDTSTVVIAAQGRCDFRVREEAVRAYVAEKMPDMPWFLFDAQVRGYQRILSRLTEEENARSCAELRELADSAGWIE